MIQDVIIDTGASHMVIDTEYLEVMDIPLLDNDELVKAIVYGGTISYSLRKNLDEIRCGDLIKNNIKIDFGVIDLVDLNIY